MPPLLIFCGGQSVSSYPSITLWPEGNEDQHGPRSLHALPYDKKYWGELCHFEEEEEGVAFLWDQCLAHAAVCVTDHSISLGDIATSTGQKGKCTS